MQAVLDTNVLVSGLLNPTGSPGRILDLILLGQLTLVYDDRIILEYQKVLSRPRFGFHPEDVAIVLAYIRSSGLILTVPPLHVELPDPDDLPFLEVALTARVPLITGNRKHFPQQALESLSIALLSPREYLDALE